MLRLRPRRRHRHRSQIVRAHRCHHDLSLQRARSPRSKCAADPRMFCLFAAVVRRLLRPHERTREMDAMTTTTTRHPPPPPILPPLCQCHCPCHCRRHYPRCRHRHVSGAATDTVTDTTVAHTTVAAILVTCAGHCLRFFAAELLYRARLRVIGRAYNDMFDHGL